MYTLEQLLLFKFFFNQAKIFLNEKDIWVVYCVNFLCSKRQHLFHQDLSTLLITLRLLPVDSMSRLNVVGIWHNDMISWTIRYFSINVLVWISNIWIAYLEYFFSLTFEGDFCSMFWHGIWFSVNTHSWFFYWPVDHFLRLSNEQ